jgi:hypothetical protein
LSAIGVVGSVMILLGAVFLYEEKRYAGKNIRQRLDDPYKPKWWVAFFIFGLGLIATQSTKIF